MKFLPYLLAATLTLGWLNAAESNPAPSAGKPAADTPDHKSIGGFEAQVFLTDNPRIFVDWSGQKSPKIKPAEVARRGVPIYAGILFADHSLDAGGKANVTCDFTVRKPDGSVYAKEKDIPVWRSRYPAHAPGLQISEGSMGIIIDPPDPAGRYTVEAVVHDTIKKTDLTVETTFEVLR